MTGPLFSGKLPFMLSSILNGNKELRFPFRQCNTALFIHLSFCLCWSLKSLHSPSSAKQCWKRLKWFWIWRALQMNIGWREEGGSGFDESAPRLLIFVRTFINANRYQNVSNYQDTVPLDLPSAWGGGGGCGGGGGGQEPNHMAKHWDQSNSVLLQFFTELLTL